MALTWDVVIVDEENGVRSLEYFTHTLCQPVQLIGEWVFPDFFVLGIFHNMYILHLCYSYYIYDEIGNFLFLAWRGSSLEHVLAFCDS